jgi:hypothetical protein
MKKASPGVSPATPHAAHPARRSGDDVPGRWIPVADPPEQPRRTSISVNTNVTNPDGRDSSDRTTRSVSPTRKPSVPGSTSRDPQPDTTHPAVAAARRLTRRHSPHVESHRRELRVHRYRMSHRSTRPRTLCRRRRGRRRTSVARVQQPYHARRVDEPQRIWPLLGDGSRLGCAWRCAVNIVG